MIELQEEQQTNQNEEIIQQTNTNQELMKMLMSNPKTYRPSLKDIEKVLPFKNHEAAVSAIAFYIFQTPEKIGEFSKLCEQTPKGVCAAPVVNNQQVYTCLDCGTQSHLFCSECFQAGLIQGKHIGHRFKAVTSMGGGFCDCGDQAYIKKSGFCSVHCGQTKCEQKLDQIIYERLQEVLLKCFQVLFNFCDQLTTYIRALPGCDFQQSMIEKPFLEFFASNVVQVLSIFIVDFCKNRLPLQIAITEIMMKPYNRKLQHVCGTNKFQQCFEKRNQHVCQQPIINLIFRYSIALNKMKQTLTKIFQSLIVNPQFKAKIPQAVLQELNFSCITLSLTGGPTVIMTEMYQIGYNFFTQKQMVLPSMEIAKQKIRFLLNLVNTQYYKQFFNGLIMANIYSSFLSHTPQLKKEQFSLSILNDYLEFSPITSQIGGMSFDHHRAKIITVSSLLNLFQDFVGNIKYKNEFSKAKVGQLINKFFFRDIIKDAVNQYMNPEQDQQQILQKADFPKKLKNKVNKQKQKQKQSPLNKIQFGWYSLQELEVGVLMASYYHYLGNEQFQVVIEQMKESTLMSILIYKLIQAQKHAYQISQSKEVGFPNQYPPKDMYRLFYRHPNRYIQDCLFSVLQIIVLTAPDLFMKELITFHPDLIIRLLTDLLMEESSYINFSKACKFQSQLVNNALRLEIINILNLKTKITFADMKKLFLEKMFSDQIEFDQILFEVSQYDSKTESYTAKDKYKGLQQAVLLRRADESYGDFFQEQGSALKMVQKDTLFENQEAQGWTTMCQKVVTQLSKTDLYYQLIQQLVSMAWQSKQSSQSYQLATLIYVLLLKGKDIKDVQMLMQNALKFKDVQTVPQKLLLEVIRKISAQPSQIIQKKQPAQVSKANGRMKAHLEKFKKMQQQFIQNNTQLIKQSEEDLSNKNLQSETTCLICHQGKLNNQYPSFLITSQSQNIEGLTLITYNSCGHHFHAKCVQEYDERICPVCKVLYDDMFPMVPSKQIHMFNPNQQNEITCNIPLNTLNFFRGNPGPQTIVQITFSKIYFSILDSCSKFMNKDLKQLRSMYAKFVIEKTNENFITQQKLIDILYSRVDYLMDHKQASDILFNMIYRLLLVPFFRGSLDMKDIFSYVVSVQYTCLLADNYLSFIDEQNEDIEGQVKQHQDAVYAKMGQFAKAAIFTYALLFDDQRNQVLNTINDEDKVGHVLIKTYNDIFTMRKDFFKQYLEKYLGNKEKQTVIPYSLVPVPYTVQIPDNYMQFHKAYYDLICDQCQGIAQFYSNQLWMCLLCGYRSCQQNCPKINFLPTASTFAHFQQHHDSSGIAIDMNSGLIGIFQSSVLFEYGYLYQNAVGKHNIENWSELKLQTNKWSKLLDILRRRTLLMYAVQSNLKARIFNKDKNNE